MKKLVPVFFCLLLFRTVALAGDFAMENHAVKIRIPEVALLNIQTPSGPDNIFLEAIEPASAGHALLPGDANSALWLNYSSVVPGSASKNRKITVHADKQISGVSVKLSVGPASATGAGRSGTGIAGEIILGQQKQDIITGIGTCFTGSGISNGHQLFYSLEIVPDAYKEIFAGDHYINVYYTITAATE